jgi:hypothetical protein
VNIIFLQANNTTYARQAKKGNGKLILVEKKFAESKSKNLFANTQSNAYNAFSLTAEIYAGFRFPRCRET